MYVNKNTLFNILPSDVLLLRQKGALVFEKTRKIGCLKDMVSYECTAKICTIHMFPNIKVCMKRFSIQVVFAMLTEIVLQTSQFISYENASLKKEGTEEEVTMVSYNLPLVIYLLSASVVLTTNEMSVYALSFLRYLSCLRCALY